MRLPRLRSSRAPKASSTTWKRAVAGFRRSFPRLLRGDFWRRAERHDWRGALFEVPTCEKKQTKKRRRSRKERRLAAAWGLSGFTPTFEPLEVRAMLSASAGSLDTTFNHTGKLLPGFTAAQATAVAFDSNLSSNDILVAGTFNNHGTNEMAVAAITATGTLDHNFNGTGFETIAIGSASQANAITVDPSGNIFVAGSALVGTNTDFAVAELSATGSLVGTFGTGGTATGPQGTASAIALQPLTVGGPLSSGYNVVLAGLNATSNSGVLIFGSSGNLIASKFTSGAGSTELAARAVAIDPATNDILVVGQKASDFTAELDVFTANASNVATHQLTALGVGSLATGIMPYNGNFLIAGTANSEFALAEITSSGALVSGFGTGGSGETETAFTGDSVANSLAVQANGKIVLAGQELDTSGNEFFAVARYDASGLLDPAFGTGGTTTTDFSGSASADSVAAGVVIEADGKIVVAGYSDAEGSDDFAISRYVANNAPTATDSATFSQIDQNEFNSQGDTVASLISQLNVTDADHDALALAVTGVDDSSGNWQFSIDGGSNWTDIPATVSDTSALYLTPSNLIRFVPDDGFFSVNSNDMQVNPDPTITVRAADQSQGARYASGTLIDAFSSTDTAADSGSAGQNLNSFSDNSYSASIEVTQLKNVVYVDSAWATGFTQGQNFSFTDARGTHNVTFGIDAFPTIQQGVDFVADNGTVYVEAGTYAENVDVTTPGVQILGPNDGIAGSSNSRVTEAIVEPGPNSSFDTSSIFDVEADNVTISGLTIEGSITSPPAGQSAGFALSTRTTTYAAAGISNAGNVVNAFSNGDRSSVTEISGLTVQDNIVKDFKWVGIYGDTDDTATPSSGNLITDNLISDVPQPAAPLIATGDDPAYAGEGVEIYDNFYADITGNVMNDVGTGIQTGNNYQPPSANFVDNITGNNITAYFRGIYYNLSYMEGTAGGFHISGNTITFDNDQPSFQLSTYNVGLLIQSLANDTTSTVSDNNVSGFLYGIEIWNDNANSTLEIQGGTLTDNTYGVWATNSDTRFGPGGTTSAILDDVTITNSTIAGVWVDAPRGGTSVSLTVQDGTTITGSETGILVQGALASATITGDSISDNGVGVDFTQGGAGSIGSTDFSGTTSNVADLLVDGTAGAVTVNDGNTFAGSSDYIDDLSPENIDLSGTTSTTFGGFNAATTAVDVSTLPSFYAVEDKLIDAIDASGLGFIRIHANEVFVTPNSFLSPATDDTGAISRAVGAAADGDTVHVESGLYHETEVVINKGLTLVGDAEATTVIDGGGESHTIPANGISSSASGVIQVTGTTATQSVTIQGLTVQNPGTPYDAVDEDFTSTIEGYEIAGALTIDNVTVIGDNDPTAGDAGIQIVFAQSTAPVTIENSDVSHAFQGMLIEDAFGQLEVTGDHVHNLVAFNDGTTTFVADGVFVFDDQGSINSSLINLSNNQLNDYTGYGLVVEGGYGGVFSGQEANIQITGNTISVAGGDAPDIGIYNGLGPASSGITSATVSGNILSGDGSAGADGIDVSGLNTGITISGNSITGTDVGIDLSLGSSTSGPSVTISGSNTISGNTTAGIKVEAGTAAISGANIFDNPIGIEFATGGGGSFTNVDFTGATANATDVDVAADAGTVTDLGTNTFAASTDYIQDLSAQDIEATTDTFGSIAPSDNTLADLFAVEGKIYDGLDIAEATPGTPMAGMVRLRANDVFLAASSEASAAGSIQRAVDLANTGTETANDDTIYMEAGAYVGAAYHDVTDGVNADAFVDKPVSIIGPNASFDPLSNSNPSNPQAILDPGSSDPSLDSTESVGIYVASSGVTIEGLTIYGSNAALAHNGGVMLNGVPIDQAEGIVSYTGVGNINVQGNLIEYTDYTGVDFYNFDNGGAATTDNIIKNNLIENLSDAQDGVGALIYNNFYAQITDNLMTDVVVGVQTGNFSNANPDNGFAPEISGNHIAASGVGIFFNLMYDNTSTFTVGDNDITAVNSAADAPWRGIIVSSIQSGVSATFQDNTIDGTNAFTSMADPSVGIEVWNTPTSGTLQSSGDHISGVDVGVLVTNLDPFFGPAGPGSTSFEITGDTISATQTGVQVNYDSSNPGNAATVSINGGTTIDAGAGTGILVSGADASATVSDTAITMTTGTGISDQGGTLTIGDPVSISGGTTGLVISGTTAVLTGNTLADMSFTGQTGNYIEIDSALGGMDTAPTTVNATGVTFDGFLAGSGNPVTDLATYDAIENKISDYLDQPGSAYVELNAAAVFVTQSSDTTTNGAIQRAVNAAVAGNSIYIAAGTYIADGDYSVSGSAVAAAFGGPGTEIAELNIDKAVSLIGPNVGVDPNTATRGDEAVIEPGASDPNSLGTADAIIVALISSSNVTIDGLTIDGNNPLLPHYVDPGTPGFGPFSTYSGEVMADGTPIDAAEDIASYSDVGNVTLQNDIVEYASMTGIDFMNGTNFSGAATTGNVITDNLIQDLSDAYGAGMGVQLYDNFYAAVTNNVMNDVYMGMQVGNFSQANPGGAGAASISNNQITAEGIGIFFNLVYEGATSFTIQNNQIGAVNNSLQTTWYGLLVTSIQSSVSQTFSDNIIDGSGANVGTQTFGYEVWNTPTSGTVESSGDQISGVDVGIWVTNEDPAFGPAAAGVNSFTIDGDTISASQTGVWIDSSALDSGASLATTIQGDTSISTTGATSVGVLVSGAGASATFSGSMGSPSATITGNSIGIEVDGGSATIAYATINSNTTGIEFTNGGSGSLANNNFDGTNNGTDLYIASNAGSVTDDGGNKFAGMTFIDNESSQAIDATGDTFDVGPSNSQVGGNSLTNAEAYAVEDRIIDAIDVEGLGLVRIVDNNVYVTPNSFYATDGTTTPSIQRAVDAATAGDTVNIENGTYVGQVLVTKNLTLAGESRSGVVVQANGSLSTPFSTGSGDKYPVIGAIGAIVTIQGLTVDGDAQGNNYGDGFLGIAYYNAGGVIENVTVENVENDPFNGDQDGVGIYADNEDGHSRSLTISGDSIVNYQKNGMALFGTNLTLSVTHNVVTGAGDTTLIAQNGIEVGDGATGTISNNTVSGNEYSGAGGGADQFTDVQSTGLLLFSTSGLTVENNTIDGNDIGIYNSTDNALISDNTLGSTVANRYVGIMEDQGSSTISGNSINGGDLGIDVVTFDGESGEVAAAVVEGNTVTGAGVGLEAIMQSSGDPTVEVLAQNNVLTGDGEGVVISGGAIVDLGYDVGAQSPPASSNFTGLGTSTGHNTLTGYTGVGGNWAIDDQNAMGQANVLAEDNNFGPWSANDPSVIASVINDPNTSSIVYYLPALNEQPAPAIVYVNAAWANSALGSDPGSLGVGNSFGFNEFSDIQTAIDAVANGGTVMIANGTYDPSNILINHSVTIEGASESGVVITPSSSLTDSHDDSSFGGTVSNGFIIAASNVTIEDLTLDGGADQNFRDGIITNSANDGHTYNNLTVQDVTVENANRKGIAIYNFSGTATGIVIKNDTLENIGTTSDQYEGTAAIAVFGSNATIEGNMISSSAGGILGNTFDGSAELLSITGNMISSPSTTLADGALGIDVAALAAGSTVTDNTVNLTGGTGNDLGIVVSFDHGAVTVSDNGVTAVGGDDGILLYQDSTAVAVSGNTITGTTDTGAGILVTAQSSDTGRFGDVPGDVEATLTGNTIGGFADGIVVTSDDVAGDTASANIGDGTMAGQNSISGASDGIVFSGALVSGAINDNSITDSTLAGIQDLGANATISNNSITGGGDGIDADTLDSAYPVLTISGNTISGGSGHGMDLHDLGDGSVIGGSDPSDGNNVTITGGGIGIFAGFAQGSLTIENNMITASGDAAIGIDAVATAGALTISDNSVSGSSISIDVNQSQGAATVSGNTVTNSEDGDGIVVFNDATAANVSGNMLTSTSSVADVSGDAAGILITSGGSGTSAADITTNTISGYATGIQLDSTLGSTVSASIGGSMADANTVSGATTGILLAGSATTATIDDNIFVGNHKDLVINAGSLVTSLTGNAFSGSEFIDDLGTGNIDATSDTFNVGASNAAVAGSSLTLTEAFAVEDRITDAIDDGSLGFVRIQDMHVFVTPNSFYPTGGTTAPSIQRGIAVASTGDTVYVEAGMYSSDVNVNKSITLSGAGAGVAAPGRSAPESIINSPNGTTELEISASDATVDGFTIQGNTNGNVFGDGIFITPGVSGTHVLDNIVQDNIIGMHLANASATDQAVIEGNLFQNNNNSGPSGGTDIYADQFSAGGVVSDVLIEGNTFTNSTYVDGATGIGISNSDDAHPFTNITVSGNTVTNSGGGFYFFDATDVSVESNVVTGADFALALAGDINTNTTVSGNSFNENGYGIEIEDFLSATADVTGLSIHNNFLDSNTTDGIYIDSTAIVSSGGIAINANSIAGNTVAGLDNESTIAIDATGNWWGSAAGPDSPLNTYAPNNPAGDTIIDPGTTIAPWLTSGAFDATRLPGFYPTSALDASPPSLTGQTNQTAVEGNSKSIDLGSFVDSYAAPAGDTIVVNWGDGSPDSSVAPLSGNGNNPVAIGSLSHTYADPGVYDVTITVTDESGLQNNTSSPSFTVSVADAPLTDTTPVQTLPATEGNPTGSQVLMTFNDGDPNATLSDYEAPIVNWGGALQAGTTPSMSIQEVSVSGGASHWEVLGNAIYAEPGMYNVSVTVNDVDGNSASTHNTTFNVADAPLMATGTNISPTQGVAFSNVQVGTLTDTEGMFSNPADLSATINWGDSTPTSAATLVEIGSTGVYQVEGTHTYANFGNFTVSVSYTDHGGSTTTSTSTATVAQAANVPLTGNATATEGTAYTLNLGTPTVAGGYQIGQYEINWGDNFQTSFVTGPAGNAAAGAQMVTYIAEHPFSGPITVSIFSTDDTLIGIDTKSITVNPATIHLLATNTGPITQGQGVNVSGFGVIDPSYANQSLATYTFKFTTTTGFSQTVTESEGVTNATVFIPSSFLSNVGPYVVTVSVTDGQAGSLQGSGSATTTVTVNPNPLAGTFHVTQFTPTATGFDVTFSAPMGAGPNFSHLNLYEGNGDELGAPDLTVVGTNTGPVQGSLVWNAATNTASFVTTDSVLMPDNYTVTLVSGATAWEDTNGNLLLGSDDVVGHNYVANFTVAPPASNSPVLNLPSFARGPGQNVSVSDSPGDVGTADSSNNLPITITTTATSNVLSVDFELDYNSNYLDVTNVVKGDLPAGWTVTFNLMQSAGKVLVSASGTSPLPIGQTTLVELVANVPDSAADDYGASALLSLTNVEFNGGELSGTVGRALEKVAYFGDAAGFGALSGVDASLVAQNVVQLSNGFSAYPLTDPRIIANVTGTGELSGLDASFISQAIVEDPVPQIPAIPNISVTDFDGPDPTVTIAMNVQAADGQMVNVPISIDQVFVNGHGLESVDLAITYDPTVLSLTDSGVTLGSYLASLNGNSSWSITSNVMTSGGNQTGEVLIDMFSATALNQNTQNTETPLTLLNLDFSVLANAAAGSTPVSIDTNTFTNRQLNGGQLTMSFFNGNVVVQPALQVVGSSPSIVFAGSMTDVPFNQFTLNFNESLNPTEANSAASYQLFDETSHTSYTLTPSYTANSTSVLLTVNAGNLPIGTYQLTIPEADLQSALGSDLTGNYTTTFEIVDPLTVLNTNDSGVGSLREVISNADALGGPSQTITFAIPSGPQTINLLSALPASTVAIVAQLDSTQNVTIESPSPSIMDSFSAMTKTGDGTLTLAGANNLTGNVEVDGGSLAFNDSTTPVLAPSISAITEEGGTLQLAGSVSDLSSSVNITNNSNSGGLLVSGTNQVAGNITGTGTVVLAPGSHLTVNSIDQTSLIIGAGATLAIMPSTGNGPGVATTNGLASLEVNSLASAIGNPVSNGSTIENASSIGDGVSTSAPTLAPPIVAPIATISTDSLPPSIAADAPTVAATDASFAALLAVPVTRLPGPSESDGIAESPRPDVAMPDLDVAAANVDLGNAIPTTVAPAIAAIPVSDDVRSPAIAGGTDLAGSTNGFSAVRQGDDSQVAAADGARHHAVDAIFADGDDFLGGIDESLAGLLASGRRI